MDPPQIPPSYDMIRIWLMSLQILYLTRCHRLDAATLIMLSRAVHGGQRCARVIAHASALINFTWPSYSNVNFGLRL
jgi:hypothetical protein